MATNHSPTTAVTKSTQPSQRTTLGHYPSRSWRSRLEVGATALAIVSRLSRVSCQCAAVSAVSVVSLRVIHYLSRLLVVYVSICLAIYLSSDLIRPTANLSVPQAVRRSSLDSIHPLGLDVYIVGLATHSTQLPHCRHHRDHNSRKLSSTLDNFIYSMYRSVSTPLGLGLTSRHPRARIIRPDLALQSLIVRLPDRLSRRPPVFVSCHTISVSMSTGCHRSATDHLVSCGDL